MVFSVGRTVLPKKGGDVGKPLKKQNKMSEANRFVGFWKILECVPETATADKKGIQGTIFQLSKTGDVIWKIPKDAVTIPLFNCETYEVVTRGSFIANPFLRFGAYKGHVIEFRVDFSDPEVVLIIISEGWCLLRCKKLDDVNPEDPVDLPFSLLPALEDSYFSDLTITASNNKQFRVHTCILKLGAPELDWSAKPAPLSRLPEEVLGTILHYLYAQCLPIGLEEGVVKQVITAASDLSGLESLVSMCQLYVKNLALKQQIISLVSDLHACAAQVIDYFSNKHSTSSEYSENLTSDPAKLCFAVKSSIRETAVAVSKLLLLCDLYTKRKDELSREEGHEIIRYAKSRIPIFMNQLERFLQGVKSTFSNLLPSQRQEVACYLVPEIETILDTISSLLVKFKASLEVMLTHTEVEEEAYSHIKLETLEQHMDNALHKKELGKIRCLLQRVTFTVMHLQQKKESFKVMTSGNKIRSIARNLDQLLEELPIFLLRLEEVTGALDEKLEWNESQFCFKVGTSKVSENVKRLRLHKDSLQDLMIQLCDLVQRDAFSQSLVALGLLDPSLSSATNPSENNRGEKCSQWTPKQHGYSFNLMESLCVSPPAHQNRLSKAATQLLRSGQETDMVFEVISSAESDSVIDHTGENPVETQVEPNAEPEISRIEAHRVIVAARCDWFRRALLSGMQEDINRKIQVHNTSPYLFSLFLEYLYSGRLDCSSLTVDHIAELLLLSDRYELDSLKQACENGLKSHLDEDSVLYFFSMADQFNAKILKSACVQFIAQHPDVMDSELFEELPDNLQTEIYDVVIWVKPQPMYLAPDKGLTPTPYSVADIEEMAANVHISSNRDVSRSESDELQPAQDSARLETALEQLIDIVGHGVSRTQLVQIVLAADYDINRALNFYYSSS